MIGHDDPRHGTSAGYCAGCHETCCRTGIAEYARGLRTRQYLAGGPLVIDATGTKRRLRALMALGWTGPQIDAALGRARTFTANLLCGSPRVNRVTADLVATVYERMSMRLPDDEPTPNRQLITRTRNQARRKGWAPPLAWDDIDNPDEEPSTPDPVMVDEVVVARVLAGEVLPCTPHERRTVLERAAAAGRSLSDLCRQMGWKQGRYYRTGEAA